ncbi:MAG: SDR family oxidoreductase [Desulfarculaceae bacterium]|nr:SDR family oxidoreductase [Desulfarculaceae bacterium]MCF8071970.1 SDR family oxidoreductase [Desulfarculaceae bacterium]MCF8101487.1 SDR family oxidoreductase [Desulfarculaceae bacterium]MCF8115037.1 SDR family oxidoreductase [Desulfarculaceae bacterium]
MSSNKPVALVAGGANNIGAACARLMARDHFVVVADMGDPSAVVEELGPERALGLRGDISNYPDCQAWVAEAEKHGPLKSLINTVGMSTPGEFVENLDLEEWDRVLKVNLTGSFYLSRAAIPAMKRSGLEDKSIVLISSRSGKGGTASLGATKMSKAHYCCSKAGVICLVKCLAYELSEDQIRVNSVAPGPIKSLNPDGRPGATINPDFWETIAQKVPLKRMGDPEDIADACYFLCSDRARFITGHTLDVNGGTLMD